MGKLEIFDKSDFIALALTYSTTPTICAEVAIKGLHSQILLHGIIDLVSFTKSATEKGLVLALLCNINCANITSTTVKTLTSYSSIGSKRQAVELVKLCCKVIRIFSASLCWRCAGSVLSHTFTYHNMIHFLEQSLTLHYIQNQPVVM